PIADGAREAALPHTFVWRKPLGVLDGRRPDVVVVTGWWLAAQLEACPAPLVVDLAGSVLLEFLAQDPAKAARLAPHKLEALAAADFVTCASERQRHYFQPWLLLGGFTPDDCLTRCAAVRISCDPDLPAHAPPAAEPRFVYSGMALAWQDPLPALEATLAVLERRGRGRLDLYTGYHPVHSRGADWYGRLEAWAAGRERVALHGLLPYDDLLAVYRRSDAAVDLFPRTLERELAFNTRTVDYLHSGVAPIYGDYTELAALIRAYDAGFTVDPADPARLTAAVEMALDCPDRLLARRRNAQRLAREELAWDRTIAPLAAFCAAPTKRAAGPLAAAMFVPDAARDPAEDAARAAELAALREHAARVTAEWEAKNRHIAQLEAELARWHRRPWRRALRQTLARVRRGGS
ncbi:MAG TPA: hypothetical protein VFW96_23575, partial [Thermomicrobiales bacterium]|nr:hypothetical protein [Thermomicrobiales bacterium]